MDTVSWAVQFSLWEPALPSAPPQPPAKARQLPQYRAAGVKWDFSRTLSRASGFSQREPMESTGGVNNLLGLVMADPSLSVLLSRALADLAGNKGRKREVRKFLLESTESA